MHEFSTYEYAVAPKNDAKMKAKKAAFIVSYILFPLIFIAFFCTIKLYWFIFFLAMATVFAIPVAVVCFFPMILSQFGEVSY